MASMKPRKLFSGARSGMPRWAMRKNDHGQSAPRLVVTTGAPPRVLHGVLLLYRVTALLLTQAEACDCGPSKHDVLADMSGDENRVEWGRGRWHKVERFWRC